jgi:hypothetical protein
MGTDWRLVRMASDLVGPSLGSALPPGASSGAVQNLMIQATAGMSPPVSMASCTELGADG